MVKLHFIMNPHALQWIAFYDLGVHNNTWTVVRIDSNNTVDPYEIITLDQHMSIIIRHANQEELIPVDVAEDS